MTPISEELRLSWSMRSCRILEALELLGTPMNPTIYLAVDDFLAEHDRAMRSAFDELF
jgi:hypothetical protein